MGHDALKPLCKTVAAHRTIGSGRWLLEVSLCRIELTRHDHELPRIESSKFHHLNRQDTKVFGAPQVFGALASDEPQTLEALEIDRQYVLLPARIDENDAVCGVRHGRPQSVILGSPASFVT